MNLAGLCEPRFPWDLLTCEFAGARAPKVPILQVFVNVIRNASESIRQSGQPGPLRITHRCLADRVRAEFSDTGVGVREPEHVFDPFYTTKAVGQGTGLGLSICYGILQQHQGSISCTNNASQGATLTIELPLAKIPLSELSAAPEERPSDNR